MHIYNAQIAPIKVVIVCVCVCVWQWLSWFGDVKTYLTMNLYQFLRMLS